MESIFSVIAETIILVLFEFPGAFIRWIFLRCKKPFKEILFDDAFPNWLITVILIAVTVITIKAL